MYRPRTVPYVAAPFRFVRTFAEDLLSRRETAGHSPGERLAPGRLPVDCTDRLEGVRLGGGLIGAITLDTREAQREAAGVLRAGLNVIECNFDNQLGAHVDGVVVAPDFERQQLPRLPRQRLVGEPLEGSCRA